MNWLGLAKVCPMLNNCGILSEPKSKMLTCQLHETHARKSHILFGKNAVGEQKHLNDNKHTYVKND